MREVTHMFTTFGYKVSYCVALAYNAPKCAFSLLEVKQYFSPFFSFKSHQHFDGKYIFQQIIAGEIEIRSSSLSLSLPLSLSLG